MDVYYCDLSKNVDIENEINFISACKSGNIVCARQLYSSGVNIHARNEEAFKWACIFGFIDIAQWLYQLGANIHINNDEPFRWACLNGNIKIALWLYTLGIDLSNLIYFKSELSEKVLKNVFQLNHQEIDLFNATICGNLERIKHVIKNGVKYDILDDFIFKKSFFENNIEIIKYLSELDTKYYENNIVTDYKNN